mmetsp:Transcript_872/g.1351  ORF Transcript_872/g.1351 Transcript_872/m.1351 type:complete len:100 (-) Transcript_872:792-1091(-)
MGSVSDKDTVLSHCNSYIMINLFLGLRGGRAPVSSHDLILFVVNKALNVLVEPAVVLSKNLKEGSKGNSLGVPKYSGKNKIEGCKELYIILEWTVKFYR